MELDGFCSGLNIAFEYHGIQHYKHQTFFHRTATSLEERVENDKIKKRLCEEHDVELIEVPYEIPLQELPNYLARTLSAQAKRWLSRSIEDVNVAKFVIPEKIREMQLVASAKGGECLSEFYINNNTRLRWRCAEGHEWEAVPSSIKSGSWCPECAGRKTPEAALHALKQIALSKGGVCLSSEYRAAKSKLRWRCAQGHEWLATPDSISNKGTWCPCCAMSVKGPARLGLQICKDKAANRGGECLSDKYTNTDTKLRWRCAEGHEWEARPDSVVRLGTWCPKCKGKLISATRKANHTRDMFQ